MSLLKLFLGTFVKRNELSFYSFFSCSSKLIIKLRARTIQIYKERERKNILFLDRIIIKNIYQIHSHISRIFEDI